MVHAATDSSARLVELERRLLREQRKVAALQDVGRALAQSLDLDGMSAAFLDPVSRIVDAERALLYVLEEELGLLTTGAVIGGEPISVELTVGQGLAGWVAQTGQTLRVTDAYADIRFDGAWDRKSGDRTHSSLCVPVRSHQGRCLGVLQVSNKTAGSFGDDDEAAMVALAGQAAVALENSKLFTSVVAKNVDLLETKEQLEQKVRELDVLFEIARVSATALDLDDLLKGVLGRTMHAINAEAGSILLADRDGGDLRFRCAVGGDPDKVMRLRVAADEGICGHVARTYSPAIVNDLRDDRRHSQEIADQTGYFPRSLLCVPLRLDDRQGALELLNKGGGEADFTEEDLKLASVIAGHVATAIRLSQAREAQDHQDRLSTIGQLLSGMMHDLRGPMTVVKGYAQLLPQEEDVGARGTFCEAILRQVQQIEAMTSEVLAFARGQSGVLLRKVYLAEFFDDLMGQLRAALSGRPVKLVFELSESGVSMLDAQKVGRAVHNLVINAAQALGDGGGTIRVAATRNTEGSLVLTCEDDGPGVPDAVRDQLFDSFTSHGKPDGTGLGLAIVKKVAEDHGGSVGVESAAGRTVFSLILPQVASGPRLHLDERVSVGQ